MKLKPFFSLLVVFFILSSVTGCSNDQNDTKLQACFTPGENCTESIVNMINQAKISIFIQAYTFSNESIIKAIIAAKQRNIDVKILFDKSLWTSENASAALLLQNKIPISLDKKVALAHNNVMIIDGNKVVTGSFDFSRDAQEKNADNLLIVQEASIGKRYLDNWRSRSVLAETVTELPKMEKTKSAYNNSKNRKIHNKKRKKRKTSHFLW